MKSTLLLICFVITIFYACEKENQITVAANTSQQHEATTSGCLKTITIINSAITTATTWDTCHYYYVQTSIGVNARLTIEPGTIIKFNKNGAMQLNAGGIIKASGTANHRIVFTSDKDDYYGNDLTGDGNSTPLPADWNQVNLNGQSHAVFKYCIFRYGGNSTFGGTLQVSGNSKNTIIDHCRFEYNQSNPGFNSARAALDATGGGVGTAITSNYFKQNTLPLGVSTAFNLDNTNIFSQNHFQCIKVSNSFVPPENISWSVTNQPFASTETLNFITKRLTLSAGVVLKFTNPSAGLNIQTSRYCVNHGAQGVRFTSFKDDYKFYDSNGDGSATSPQTGDWLGVHWNDSNRYFHWSNILYAAN